MTTNTQYLVRPEGRIGFDVTGSGPLLICVPGMGDLRSSFRHIVGPLVEAGYRVVTADLRGHGDSDTTFTEYSDVATASDMVALAEHLGGTAVIVGNSMGAGAAAIAAADRPELVDGVVLLGPFLRNPKAGAAMLALFRVIMARPWVSATWNAYLPSLYAGRRPDDFEEYRASIRTALRRPGYAGAFSRTTRTNHAPAEAALPRVSAPALVLMGELDPDFSTPQQEADWIAGQIDATVVMVPECGHYPQSQRPDIVVPAMVDFLAGVTRA